MIDSMLCVTKDVGPLIDEQATRRVEEWVEEAVAAGATVLTGRVRDGSAYAPGRAHGRAGSTKIPSEESFGPVGVLETVDSLNSRGSTTAGSGCRPASSPGTGEVAFRAAQALKVGGVVIGDVPRFRADQCPMAG